MGRRSKKTPTSPVEVETPKNIFIAPEEVILADASFSLEEMVRQSAIEELTIGELDVGPTDALDSDQLELEYDAYFGSSPLSSPSSSPSPSRPASPGPRYSSPNPTASVHHSASAAATAALSGNSKTRRNKRKTKIRRRELRQQEYIAAPRTDYAPRPTTIRKHVLPAETVKVEYKTEDFPTASTGYVARRDSGGRVHTLKHLVDDLGFQVVRASPGKTKVIVDQNDLVIVVIIGQREEKDWISVHDSAFQSLQAARRQCKFPKKSKKHRRGDFPALNCGISYGGGQEAPGNLCHSQINSKELAHLLSLPSFQRISGFATGAFATWAPKLYSHYDAHFNALLSHHPHLRRNFRSSVWASSAFNFGPTTVTAKHRDFANLPYGMCAVTALGEYDHTEGGHLVLWELKIVVEFPPGATILLPSAAISHSNTPIREGESRASFTQFSAGGLFRWVQQGFQKKNEYVASLSDEEKVKLVVENQARCKLGLSLFSTLHELRSS